MVEQLVWVADILDIEQFHLRIGIGVEVLIHILQYILDADLLAVADAPHTIEPQSFDDGTLQDKYRCGTRAADEVCPTGMQIGNGKCKDAVVVAVQQSDAVRANQGGPVLFAGIEDALFEFGTCLRLLDKAGGDDDEGTCLLLLRQQFHIVWTELRCHHEDGQFCRW